MINLTLTFLIRNLESEFREIAEELMLEFALNTDKNIYRFAEVEFYLYHRDLHQDLSAHCNSRQLTSGNWYIHRYKNSDSIKHGKRQGIDITLGNQLKGYYAGILIRAIQNENNYSDYVYGPSKVVDRIKEDCQCQFESIEDLGVHNNQFLKVITAMHLNQTVFPCPRHNLGKNTPFEFLYKAYRFIIYANKTHSGKEKVIIPYLKDKLVDEELIKREFSRKTI